MCNSIFRNMARCFLKLTENCVIGNTYNWTVLINGYSFKTPYRLWNTFFLAFTLRWLVLNKYILYKIHWIPINMILSVIWGRRHFLPERLGFIISTLALIRNKHIEAAVFAFPLTRSWKGWETESICLCFFKEASSCMQAWPLLSKSSYPLLKGSE